MPRDVTRKNISTEGIGDKEMGRGQTNGDHARRPTAVENLLLGCGIEEVPRLVPGIVLAAALVVFAIWSTDRLNAALGYRGLISYILVAIAIGIAVRNLVGVPDVFIPGVRFCLRKLLRLGIILMGIRLCIFDALRIGAWGIPIVASCVLAGLAVTSYFARLLKLPKRLGTLIAVGTSICGASAIVATASGIEAKDEEVTYAVANITIFGLVAMVLYPYLAHLLFGGDAILAGLFTGTSIHETAQVAGAGLIYDQTFVTECNLTAGDVAMVTKLVRNALMALVIPAMALLHARGEGEPQQRPGRSTVNPLRLFPLFVLGFLAMALIRSIGDANLRGGGLAIGLWSEGQWQYITGLIRRWSGYILATAMGGVGLGTSLRAMKGLGLRPFYVGLLAAALVGVVSVVMVMVLGPAVDL
jgi:uncharacterized integral membrane protein (TIGR00698 family)